ncbi:ribonuclease H-like domain-containing protein [Tanacetum coccineum]|uniref:Ribonuclease H-like domain-containing protein n=1 Tax=Tanacetum coccineum TaxID=301880 RepID=A0ABQ5D8C5_9ASTR
MKKGLGYHDVAPPHPLTLNAPTKLDLSYSGLDEFKEPKFQGYGHRDTMLKSIFVSKENTDSSLPKEQVPVDEISSVFVDENSSVESPLNVDKETVFILINCPQHQRKRMVTGNNYNKVDFNYYAKTSHLRTHRNMTPRAVLLKSGLTPLSTARPVYTAQPKQIVHSARSMSQFSNQAQSTVKRPFYNKTTLTNRYFNQKVNTARPRAVNTARPYTTPVNTVRENGVNVVKTLACWVWRPTKPNGASFVFNRYNYIDARGRSNGCSRHMTRNIAYLSDFKEFDGVYITFGGGAYGGRITGKGTLKTNSLDFKDVYFVNDLKFNLFSVSQMCDKKNYVLFTDTECLVLSPNFMLPDESQILLKILREDNMYSFDIKNIVPKRSLTCLDETSEILKNFIKEIENLVDKKVKIIRCDNGKEFKNKVMDDFCREKGIRREYNVARTLQQNGVAERRNKTLIEAARTILADSKSPTTFWVSILNTLDNLGKFDGKSDEGFFVGYSLNSKAFRVYNTITKKVEENLHIGFLENKPMIEGKYPKWLFDIDSLTQSMNYVPVTAGTSTNESAGTQGDLNAGTFIGKKGTSQDCIVMFFNDEDEPEVDLGNIPKSYAVPTTPNTRIHKDHLIKTVIGDMQSSIQTRRMTKPTSEQGFLSAVYKGKTHEDLHTCLFACFLSQEEQKRIFKALTRIKAIRLFLAYASFMGFMVYQMDVKSALLYGPIEEEVYVCQPPGFEDPNHPDKVYKVVKALYGQTQDGRVKTTGGYQFLGNMLISWQCKKQTMVATSITEAEYVSTANLLTKGFDAGRFQYLVSREANCAHKNESKNIRQKCQSNRNVKRGRDTKVPQSGGPTIKVGDEAVHKELGDRMERAATTPSSLEVEQDSGHHETDGIDGICTELYEITTATASTNANGQVELTASIDRKVKTIIEASLRRHLKLEDNGGITSLPNTKIFEQLALMGPKKTAWEQNLDSTHKFLMYPRFIQICLNKQRRLLQPHTRTYPTPILTQKVFSNMKRVSRGYSGVEFPLFPTMITPPETSPSRITSSPSLSPKPSFLPQYTPISAPSTSQPPNTQAISGAEEAAPMPHESPLHSVHSLGRDEGSLLLALKYVD